MSALKTKVTISMTPAQAKAAMNACDLIRDQYAAAGNKREADQHQRARDVIRNAIDTATKGDP